jgi:outer membrane protein TolC
MILMRRLLTIVSTLVIVSAFLSSCVRPSKDLNQLRLENADKDKEYMFKNAVLPQDPLQLEDFVALGLLQNFDVLMRQQEVAVQMEAETAAKLGMLPSLTASSELSERSNLSVISSQNINSGQASLPTNYSHPKQTKTYSLALAWSVLDFGMTYYRARQQEDRVNIAMQDYERLKQNVILDITDAYWKAIVAQKATKGALDIIGLAENRQGDLEKQMQRKTVSEIDGLENQKRLIEMQIKLQNYKRDYYKQKARLASLVGLPPMADFQVADVALPAIQVDIWDVRRLEEEAIMSRPELYIEDLNARIAADDTRTAILGMFPNANLFAGFDHDQNPFLLNNNWYSMGLRTSWNLLNIPKSYYEHRSAKAREAAAKDARLQLSIAVMTEVNIAYLDLQDSVAQYDLAVDLSSVKNRLLDAGKKGQKQGQFDDADVLTLEAEALFSDIYQVTTYADVKVALERLANSVGKPLLFSDVTIPAYVFTDDEATNSRTYQKVYIQDAQAKNDLPSVGEKVTRPDNESWNHSVANWEVNSTRNATQKVNRDVNTTWGVASTPLTQSDKAHSEVAMEYVEISETVKQ